MKIARLALVLSVTPISGLAACAVETGDGTEAGPERGLGKADGVFGSCKSADGNSCDGPASNGNCWCDDACADFGDCCADKVQTCGGDEPIDPPPQLCLTDDTCGAGNHCDHSECLSGCPDGGFCPAVCFGECVEGEPECDINPLTVFCGPGTFFSVEACACVPLDAGCSSLDEKQCDAADNCTWLTVDGFPGPISMCVDNAGNCDINPATVFCQDGKVFDVDACACVDIDPQPDCAPPDDSYTALTGDELFADLDGFVGDRVWLTGDSIPGAPICTKLACSPEAPCCNSCGAGIEMDLGAGRLEMSGIGCGGDNCSVLANCEYGFGEGFTAWGTLEQNFGLTHLVIDGHCGV